MDVHIKISKHCQMYSVADQANKYPTTKTLSEDGPIICWTDKNDATFCRTGFLQRSVQQDDVVYNSLIRYDTRCYFNVRLKADMSQLNLPHGNDN